MQNDLKLKQSNSLILSTHKMSATQMRIFFYVCSRYSGDLKMNLSFNSMNNILNADYGTKQKELLIKSISSMMKNAFIKLKIDEDDEYCEAPVFILAKKKKNEDNMQFEFNPHVAKELDELKGYTWLYLENLTGMSSTYAIRLYEFFAMRLGSQSQKGTFDYNLEKLKKYLSIEQKYSVFGDFEKRVLVVAKEQINDKTNIQMSYRKVKTGRTITSIKFTFKWKKDKNVIDVKHTVYDENEPPEGQTTIDDYLSENEEVLEMLKKYD